MQLALLAAVMSGSQRGRRSVPANLPPTVNAGTDQSVSTSATVNLSASASDPDGTISAYLWTQQSGTAVTINNSTTSTPNFTAPASPATIVIRCTVTDNLGATAFDDVQITVSASGATDTVEAPFMTTPTVSSGSMTIKWVVPDRLRSGVTPIDSPNAITSYTIYYTLVANGPDNARPGGTGVTASTVAVPTDTSKAISASAGSYWVSMSTTNAYNEGDYCAPIYVTVP